MIDKLKERIILYSYIGQAIYLFLSIFVLSTSLIIASAMTSSAPMIYFYVAGSFALADLLVFGILSALYFVGDEEERSTPRRIKGTLTLRIIFRIFAIVSNSVVIVGLFTNGALDNEGWGAFMKVYSILMDVVFFLLFLYSIWKKAWIKENPERFSYASSIGVNHPVKKREEEEKAPIHPKKSEEKPSYPVYDLTSQEDEKPALPKEPLAIEGKKKKHRNK